MSRFLTERQIVSVILLIAAAALVVSTFGLQFADLGGAFSPMFFPRIILFILIGLTALNVFVDFSTAAAPVPIRLAPVLLIGAAVFAYALLLAPLGFFISSSGVGMVILLALGLRNPALVILMPTLCAGALVLLFNHVLKMPLPSSPFFWWL